MKDLLVGATGFVGGNLRQLRSFSAECHSSDVKEYYGSRPECCIYAGVPAAMFLANTAPEQDLEVMKAARENLRMIRPERVVLISTIAVFGDSRGKDETAVPDAESAYGRNRFQLEQWVREDHAAVTVIRLPALYGRGLKKNFLYDLHRIVPAMLMADKYAELSAQSSLVKSSYIPGANGFYAMKTDCDFPALREWFAASSFNSLCFTDSRSRFQFYHLARLWRDISTALHEKLPLVHLCTPPVSAAEVYQAVRHQSGWSNEIPGRQPFDYDLRSLYAEAFGGSDGYLCSRDAEMREIADFMERWEKQEASV